MMERPGRGPVGMGLRPRAGGLGTRLRSILGMGASVSEATWDELEEALIAADVGAEMAMTLVDGARVQAGGGPAAIRDALGNEISSRLSAAGGAAWEPGPPPSIVLVVGVNGTGKTTTIAKLAARLRKQGRSVILAAADTYRAAAIEQLRLWGERLDVPVVAQRAGADPGAVAFDAVAAATSRGTDVVLVDTAGRLHNRGQLMAELGKIRRVIAGRLEGQPRHVLLVLDATTGQNGIAQAEAFSREVGVTGIVLTKLDGTAKGGVAVSVVARLGVPIVFVGFGEELDGLAPFDADAYVEWLLTPG